jgi:hypothetical protein
MRFVFLVEVQWGGRKVEEEEEEEVKEEREMIPLLDKLWSLGKEVRVSYA